MRVPGFITKGIRTVQGLASRLIEIAAAMFYEIALIGSLAVIFPLVARGLGPAQYGKYQTVYVIAAFAVTWAYAAVAAAIVQLLLQSNRSSRSLLVAGRRQVLVMTAPLGVGGMLLVLALFGWEVVLPAAIILGPELAMTGIAEVNIALLFALRGATFTTRIKVIGPILRVFGVLALFQTDNITILNLVVVNFAASTGVMLAAVYAGRSLTTNDDRPEQSETSSSEVRSLSLVYAASMSTNAAQSEGEKLVMATFRPLAELGRYQAAYRIISLPLIPLNAVYLVATKWFLPKDERPNIQVIRAQRLSGPILVYGVTVAIVIAFASPIVELVLGDQFSEAKTMTVWLCAVPLAHALADIPTIGLLGLARNKVRMWLGMGGAAFAVVVYLILVPLYGWQGAVVGTYASEIATLVAGWILLIRYQRVHDRSNAETVHSA